MLLKSIPCPLHPQLKVTTANVFICNYRSGKEQQIISDVAVNLTVTLNNVVPGNMQDVISSN
jgi:hypothetical protein